MDESLKEIFSKRQKKLLDEAFYEAIEGKKLIFFIGAGISRIMGIQGWDNLAITLIKNAFSEYISSSTILNSIKDNKQLISIAYNEFKNTNRLNEFYKFFGEALKPNQNKTTSENVYELLAKFDASYLTTNADNLFEEVLGKEFCHIGKDYPLNDTHLKIHHLYYLHGHFTECEDHDNDCLVFTAEQYVKRYNDISFQEFLMKIFHQDNVIIFIGYGLNEYEIIDYIVTKTGGKPENNKVYILEPFCKNDDILYNSKKSFFESLNITLIPYDISVNGYSQIIDVLKEWYENTKRSAIVPVLEDIKDWCNNYNAENLNEIIGYLRRNNDFSHEQIITDEIMKNKDFRWITSLYERGLFSKEIIDKKIKLRLWPLLSLFVDWISSGDSIAQDKAIHFLDLLSTQNIKELKIYNNRISDYIIYMIMNLDRQHIKVKYLNIAHKLMGIDKMFYYKIENNNYFDNIVSWNIRHINKFLNIIFSFSEFEKYRDNNSYYIQMIIEKFNSSIIKIPNGNYIYTFMVEYFIDFILEQAKKQEFNLFERLYNLDHIQNNNYESWKIVFNELLLYFEKLDLKNKNKFIINLIVSNSLLDNKLGLYLARKFNLFIQSDFINNRYFNSHILYHELYLFIKSQVDNNYIVDNQVQTLYDLIEQATWGIDECADIDKEYWIRKVIAKKIEMLSLFNNNKCREKVSEYIKQGYKSYNSIEIAKSVDFVKSTSWEPLFPFPKDKFDKNPLENWGIVYASNIPHYDYEIIDYSEKFVELIIQRSKEDLEIILTSLKKHSFNKLGPIMSQLNSKFEKLSSTVELYNFCLRILDILYMKKDCLNSNEKSLTRNLFKIIDKIKLDSLENITELLTRLYKWVPIFINTKNNIMQEERIVDDLINRWDYDKYSLIIKLHIDLKKKYGVLLSSEQKDELMKVLKCEKDKTLLYTLCFNYQNLKFISNNTVNEIYEYIFDKSRFSMTSLLLCICNSNYLFDELINLIVEKYLNNEIILSKGLKYHILADRFYSYIMSAYNYEKLTLEDYTKSFKDSDFIDTLLMYLPYRIKEDCYDFNKWVIFSWNQIKLHCGTELINKYAEKMLYTLDEVKTPTEESLDLYLDVISYCKNEKYFSGLESLLSYFKINYKKADKLINEIVDEYSNINLKNLDELMHFYSYDKYKVRAGKRLLNKLKSKGVINSIIAEKFSKKLDEQIKNR